MPEQKPGSGILERLDAHDIIVAVVAAVVILTLYHLLFQR
jgi:uncharacterized membrane protein YeaQ/YmgE (transglycosylase-associated protein family)